MQNIDFLELEADTDLVALQAKMEDGGIDDWVTTNVSTITKYTNFAILEELEDISRLVNKDYNEITLNKLLDDRILRLVAVLKPSR